MVSPFDMTLVITECGFRITPWFWTLSFLYQIELNLNLIDLYNKESSTVIVDHFRCTPWYSASSPFFFHLFHLHCFLFNPPLLPQTFSYFFSAPLFLPLVAVVRYHRHYHSLSRLNYQIIMNCFVIQGCNMKYRISNQLFHSYDMKVLGRFWPHNAVCDQRGTTSVQKS